MLLYPFMEAWGGADVNAAIQAVDRFPAYHRPGLLSAIVRSYAKVAPREAVGLLGDIGSPHYHYCAALSALTNVDPNAAQSALEKLPHGETRVATLEAVAKERASKNPEAALAWAKGLAFGADRRQVIHLCIERLARGDYKKILALIDEAGWEYAVDRPGDGMVRSVDLALPSLARENSKEALSLLAKLPKGEGYEGRIERNEGMATEIARLWFQQNPVEALDWIQQAPPGEEGKVFRRARFKKRRKINSPRLPSI